MIIFKNDSNLLTKVDPEITKQLKECAYDDDIIIDSLNGYEVELPSIQIPKIKQDISEELKPDDDDVLTTCECVWSDKYGLIAIFMSNFIYHFDWFGDFTWKR